MRDARVIAICGKICSGKSYYARALCQRENGVILSCDELTFALFDGKLGEQHDAVSARIQAYFLRKAVEIVRTGVPVLLDWGFWRASHRRETTAFFSAHGIRCEWHYMDVKPAVWQKNIEERNRRVLSGEEKESYYLDEGLMHKLLTRWESPSREEINIWHTVVR